MVHQRSLEAKMRRLTRRLLPTHVFRDQRLAETVCIQRFERVVTVYGKPLETPLREVVGVERGEVLVDSRGRGSLQK